MGRSLTFSGQANGILAEPEAPQYPDFQSIKYFSTCQHVPNELHFSEACFQ
jgi:hypothetical protein